MKKLILFALLITSTISFAQEDKLLLLDTNKKHELKINALSLIGFEWFDVSYEYLIDEESSFGTSLLFSFNESEVSDEYKTFSITPYYRRYFSKNYAKGFFVEGFGMLNTFKEHTYYYGAPSTTEQKTDFALGVSVGGKFVTKKGFVTEIYLGIGRNLFNASENFTRVVGRAGISLGYRF